MADKKDTDAVSEEDAKTAAPETETAPKAKAAPKTKAAPKAKADSKTKAAPKAKAASKTKAAPKAEAAPEAETAPESKATPEAKPAPKAETAPEAAPEAAKPSEPLRSLADLGAAIWRPAVASLLAASVLWAVTLSAWWPVRPAPAMGVAMLVYGLVYALLLVGLPGGWTRLREWREQR